MVSNCSPIGALHLPKRPDKTPLIDETLSLIVPCRADEPGLRSTLDSLLAASPVATSCRPPAWRRNPGLPERCRPPTGPVSAAATRCASSVPATPSRSDEIDAVLGRAGSNALHRISLHRRAAVWGAWTCRVLLADWRGKPPGHERPVAAGRAATCWLFCDADVRVAPRRPGPAYTPRMQNGRRGLRLVAAREVPILDTQGQPVESDGGAAVPVRLRQCRRPPVHDPRKDALQRSACPKTCCWKMPG